MAQAGDGVVAGAEVVDAEGDADAPELVEVVQSEVAVDEDGFGDFEDELLGGQAGRGEASCDVADDLGSEMCRPEMLTTIVTAPASASTGSLVH